MAEQCPDEQDPAVATVTLYVAGGAPWSVTAARKLAAALELLGARATSAVRVEIVDVLTEPDRALEVGLLATPSLAVMVKGAPRLWFIGDLRRTGDLAPWLADALN